MNGNIFPGRDTTRGAVICIARIASRVAPDLCPANHGSRYPARTEPRALLWLSSRKASGAYLHWFFVSKNHQPGDPWVDPTNTRLACPVAEEGGFSVLIRKAQTPGVSFTARRAHAPVFTREAIRGKTGPVPNGAVLFGPFSWAYKKKDVKKKVNHRLAVSQHRSVQAGAHDNARQALSSANRRRPSGRGPLPPRRGGVDPNIHAADTGKNDNQLTRRHKGKGSDQRSARSA